MSNTFTAAALETVDTLCRAALAGELAGTAASELVATSAFWMCHTTRLAGSAVTYLNHYVLVRCGTSFGAASFAEGEVSSDYCANISGRTLAEIIETAPQLAVRVAALDAYLAETAPHRDALEAERVLLPLGRPEQRAVARDRAIAELLDIQQGHNVALIGVVNPLVAAIEERGGSCLPCDFNLRVTQWNQPVAQSMDDVLDHADAVVATGMTLANGTFDRILAHCRSRKRPLIIYAQTGAAVARAFLGAGVTAVCAEPFPFSQFSADPTAMYRYRSQRSGAGS